MIRIAHVVHPGVFAAASDLGRAQPITFATMEAARAFVKDTLVVQPYAVLFEDESRMALPASFVRIPELARSIADLKSFRRRRKLALLKDILAAVDRHSDAEYFIYSNIDIALQPFFYWTVSQLIEQGWEALVINRRTIPDTYNDVRDIPLMYAEIGLPHKGYDCFIFKREFFQRFKLGDIHVGSAGIGRALLANLVAYGGKFREIRDAHLTFHIGDSMSWRQDEYHDYFQENWNEYLALFKQIEAERGEFDPLLRSYLLDMGEKRFIPDFSSRFIANGFCLPQPRP